MLINDVKREEGDNEERFLWKLGTMKDNGLLEDGTWVGIANRMNREFRADETEYRTECAYRKQFASARLFFENVFSAQCKDTLDTTEQLEQIKKERIKLQDERTAYQRKLREQARLERQLDTLGASLKQIGKASFVPADYGGVKVPGASRQEMIVVLSDLHIGAEYYSMKGVYNPDIALERVAKYAEKVKHIQKQWGCKRCNLVILGDLIEGGIHITSRIESAENVVEQVKTATLLISNFVTQMSAVFEEVSVYNISGNHSRIDPNKDQSLRDERLDNLIGWCAENMLAHLGNVTFTDPMDATIDMMEICGRNYLLTHGDFDDFTNTGIGKLCLMVGFVPYAVISGHKHYPMLSEVNGVKVVRSGCLCGSGGDYAVKHRLSGSASQTVLIVSEDGIEAHYPVELE